MLPIDIAGEMGNFEIVNEFITQQKEIWKTKTIENFDLEAN